jgi:hypothetical protein
VLLGISKRIKFANDELVSVTSGPGLGLFRSLRERAAIEAYSLKSLPASLIVCQGIRPTR